jgi:hypothetical protein
MPTPRSDSFFQGTLEQWIATKGHHGLRIKYLSYIENGTVREGGRIAVDAKGDVVAWEYVTLSWTIVIPVNGSS